ncbi:recombinase family protein [Paenibacillus larvae]
MDIFAYVRVSTDEQAEKGNSLAEQQERLIAYCKAMDWDSPNWYIDNGFSAKDIRRPQLTKMIEDIKKSKNHGIVVTTKLDRLSRNLFDILNVVGLLEKNNFKYVSTSESFDTSTAAGRLTLQVLGMVAEFERERNSERVRENMLSLAKKINNGRAISRPCFGFDIIDGKYEVNLEEAIITNKMADMVIEKGPRATIKWLFNNGILTKEGNVWHEKTLREYLQRETLIGHMVYNRTYKKGNKLFKRPPEEWITIENHHLAILDEAKFRKLQELYQARKTIGRRLHEDRYLLSGLVYCGHCGSKMNGKLNRSYSKRLGKENLHYKYMCDGYLKKGNCFHHVVSRDELENIIIERIHQVAKSAPGTLQLVVAKPKRELLGKDKIKASLEKLDRKFQKQIEAYEDDLISKDDLKIAKKRVEDEKKRLLEALELNDEKDNFHEQQKLKENANKLISSISSVDRLKVKHAMRRLINKIEITNSEEITITWSLSN